MDVVMRRGPNEAASRRAGRGSVFLVALALAVGICGPAPLAGQEPDPKGVDVPAILTLEEAVESAVQLNPELDAARLELEQAREQVDEACGNVFPTADLTSSFTRNLSVPGRRLGTSRASTAYAAFSIAAVYAPVRAAPLHLARCR